MNDYYASLNGYKKKFMDIVFMCFFEAGFLNYINYLLFLKIKNLKPLDSSYIRQLLNKGPNLIFISL